MITLIGLILMTMALTACGKSEFSAVTESEKRIKITAENTEKDASLTAGFLEVAEKEQVVISGDLSKGSVRVEVIKAPEGATLEQLNSLGGEAAIAANVVKAEGFNGPVAAGRYFVKAVCLEKAAGTINIEVKPAG